MTETSDAKIRLKIGKIEFMAQGDREWLATQFDKVLELAPDLLSASDENGLLDEDVDEDASTDQNGEDVSKVPLAKFLKRCDANGNQVKRFLATALWLTERGTARPSTSDVSKALKDNHQSRLSNPSDCLSKNVAKGYCEKDGNKFFVTPDGRENLGQ